MRFLRRVREDMGKGESIDVIVAIIAAFVLAALDICGPRTLFGIDMQSLLAPLTLAILGMLLVAMLQNRHRMQDLAQEIGSSTNPPLRYRTDLPSLEDRSADASEIHIVALSGAELLRQVEYFVDRIRRGASIRLAIANPESNALLEAVRPLTGVTTDEFIADMIVAKGLLRRITDDIARLDPSRAGLFEVRVFDHAPTLSMVMVNGGLSTGHIVVEMRPYRVSSSRRPSLFLTAKDHPDWYSYFRDVCLSIWQNAEPWSGY